MKEVPQPAEYGDLVVDAVNALARMEADRLEDVARRCRALDQEPVRRTIAGFAHLRREMAMLVRVLEATRGNANLMRRLRKLNSPDIEYRCEPEGGWFVVRSGDGHDSIGV